MQLKRVTDGGLGASPIRKAIFCIKKKAILMPLDHILHVLELFERTRFSIFESQLKQLNCSILLYSHFTSKTRLKSCIMGLNFVIWPSSESKE